ncbi:MAG: hypothetical protein Q9160_005299 [Pyrenula sp. 1 TL-2023]
MTRIVVQNDRHTTDSSKTTFDFRPRNSPVTVQVEEGAPSNNTPPQHASYSSSTSGNDNGDNDSDNDLSTATAIHASTLIPGRGASQRDQIVILKSGKIAHIGPPSSLPKKYSSLKPTSVKYLLPGLWDCHVHFMGLAALSLPDLNSTSPAALGLRLARSAQDVLFAGFTSVRDVGGYAPEIDTVFKDPKSGLIGPSLYGAGAAISQTAGHGDQFELPLGWVWGGMSVNDTGTMPGLQPVMLADGVEECRKAIRMQIRRGAKCIKILASGGVLSRDDDPEYAQFSPEELDVMVKEAARMERLLAAHVHGKAGIMAALRAGVHTMEHGTGLDEEAIELMKEKGAMLVATRTIVSQGNDNLDELPNEETKRKMRWANERHKKAYALAVKSGVKCALGTDIGVSQPGAPISHGMNGEELSHAVEAGMTPMQAIEAATANGPETLNREGAGHGMAPLSGQLRVGWDADLIALEEDPVKDVGLFKDPANVKWVWKAGRLVKGPGMGGPLVG